MTLTEQILKEFDEKFVNHMIESSHFEDKWEDFKNRRDLPKEVKDFLLSALARTREECAKEVEGMKCDEKKIHTFGEWQAETYEEKMLVNAVLSDAASKIREIK